MIPDFKTYIGESAWGDMMRRGSGEEIRKEDDINLLDKDGLYEYILKHYEVIEDVGPNTITCGSRFLNISLFLYPRITRSIIVDPIDKYIVVRTPIIKQWPENILELISEKYKREDIINKAQDHMTLISSKDGESDNKFFIDFIDTIISEADKPVLRKKVNESAWGDMMRRGSGETVRKEDIIKSSEDLREKIEELYKEQGEGDTLDVSSLSKLIACDNFRELFFNLRMKQIIGLETWDVSKVTNMCSMFESCIYLKELNISNWNVSNVTDMRFMFSGCHSLKELNISNWNVSNVTDMDSIFSRCKSLEELNISNWNVSNVTDMHNMFYNCESLKELNIDTWDVSNANNMYGMFNGCNKLIKPKWYKDE